MHNALILGAPGSVRGSVEMVRRAFPDLGVELDLIAEDHRIIGSDDELASNR